MNVNVNTAGIVLWADCNIQTTRAIQKVWKTNRVKPHRADDLRGTVTARSVDCISIRAWTRVVEGYEISGGTSPDQHVFTLV